METGCEGVDWVHLARAWPSDLSYEQIHEILGAEKVGNLLTVYYPPKMGWEMAIRFQFLINTGFHCIFSYHKHHPIFK
jgi:hypothetical protein